MRTRFALFLAATFLATPALADRMTGQEVAAMMSQGPLQFQAGSVFRITGRGEYVFEHGSASAEEGTFRVFADGTVEIFDEGSGRTIRFYFDDPAGQNPTLVYLTGPSKGNRYPLR